MDDAHAAAPDEERGLARLQARAQLRAKTRELKQVSDRVSNMASEEAKIKHAIAKAREQTRERQMAKQRVEEGRQAKAQMKAWVATKGPLSVHVNAGGWSRYKGGVMTQPPSTKLDHVVLVVGYGVDPVQGDYWVIRNSWGDGWGEAGYVRLARGVRASGVSEEPASILA